MGVRSSKRLAKVPQAANRWARSYMSPAILPLVPSDWVEPDYLDPIDYALNADYVLPLGCYLFRVVLLSSSSCTSGPSNGEQCRRLVRYFPCLVGLFHSGDDMCSWCYYFFGWAVQGFVAVAFGTGRKRWVWVGWRVNTNGAEEDLHVVGTKRWNCCCFLAQRYSTYVCICT